MLPMQPIPCPQSSCLRAPYPLPQQPLQAPLHLAYPARVPLGTQLGAALSQMNRFAKESLHGNSPRQLGPPVKQPLEVSQLMSQAQLPPLGGGRELGTQTITDPALGPLLPHDFRDHFRSAARPDQEVDPHDTPKDPLPPVAACHASPGLVAANDRALRHLPPNRGRHRLCGLPRSLQDGARAPFADRYPKEVAAKLGHPLIAQMLLVFQVDHSCC